MKKNKLIFSRDGLLEIKIFPKKDEEYLKGRKVHLDSNCGKINLTAYEIKIIKFWIRKKCVIKIPTIIPISGRIFIDFIGYNNKEYMDILICRGVKKHFNYN